MLSFWLLETRRSLDRSVTFTKTRSTTQPGTHTTNPSRKRRRSYMYGRGGGREGFRHRRFEKTFWETGKSIWLYQWIPCIFGGGGGKLNWRSMGWLAEKGGVIGENGRKTRFFIFFIFWHKRFLLKSPWAAEQHVILIKCTPTPML